MARNQVQTGNPLILIGDEVSPAPYLRNLVDAIRAENETLLEDTQIHYLVCRTYRDLALSLKAKKELIRLVLAGPGLDGKPDVVARLLGTNVQTIVVVDPEKRPLAEDRRTAQKLVTNLKRIGSTVVLARDATPDFYKPIVQERVVAGLNSNLDIAQMTPEQRAEVLDKRLETVTMFPSLPETQNRVSALDDMAPPKKWAQAIEHDLPIKTVILQSLNSAHYSFRYPVRSIEQAVSLASARTIRELVLSCTVRRLFKKIAEGRVEQFWKHSVATAFFARVLSLPASLESQSPQQKSEFARLGLEEPHVVMLEQLQLWTRFDADDGADAFTAGLLHDIGKVTMALCFEDSLLLLDPIIEEGVVNAESRGELWAEPSTKVERDLMLDLDHQIIGSRLAKRWSLDLALQQAISQHHSVQRKSPPHLKLLALANLAANTLYSYPLTKEQAPLARLFQRIRAASKAYEGDEHRDYVVNAIKEDLASDFESVVTRLEVPDHLWQIVDMPTFFSFCYFFGQPVKRATGAFLQMTAATA